MKPDRGLMRSYMIDRLVEDMDNWDLETIVGWAQHVRREQLEASDIKSIRSEYEDAFPDEDADA